eukprot:scaffold83127_cov42-Cyclotella_meneghiniana.AAC.1
MLPSGTQKTALHLVHMLDGPLIIQRDSNMPEDTTEMLNLSYQYHPGQTGFSRQVQSGLGYDPLILDPSHQESPPLATPPPLRTHTPHPRNIRALRARLFSPVFAVEDNATSRSNLTTSS